MGGEMYCDGGIVASNPSAIAIHEARNIYPEVPIELVVSIGTGGFLEQKIRTSNWLGWHNWTNYQLCNRRRADSSYFGRRVGRWPNKIIRLKYSLHEV